MYSGDLNPSYRHGHTSGKFSPTYHSWACMIQRCTNPKRTYYQHYGGKGVKVCERWLQFENFLADMGERPSKKHSLDRIDNDGDYEPGNCRWADANTQARNSSQTAYVELNGERLPLVTWCERLGVSINTVRHRVKYHGYTYQAALTKPVQTTADRIALCRAMNKGK